MSFLQPVSLLQHINSEYIGNTSPPCSPHKGQPRRQIRPIKSLANLVHCARNPVAVASEAIEDWYDGSTKEERARRQSVADQQQLLYLKMRTVSLSGSRLIHTPLTDTPLGNIL